MVGRPGRMQASFASGELEPFLHERTELKFYNNGLKHAENVALSPQGGFWQADGMQHVGNLGTTARRGVNFKASNSAVYDVVFESGQIRIWGETALLASVAHPYTEAQVRDLTFAQLLDTLLIFHPDHAPRRLKHAGASSWSMDLAPLKNIPNADLGGTYTNGVAAVWELEFVGFTGNSIATTAFILTVSGQDTRSILPVTFSGEFTGINYPDTALVIRDAILELPNVSPGITVSAITSGSKSKIQITFSGVGNEGDGWAVSGRVVNKVDAAVIAFRASRGVAPGEPIVSTTRGWPRCGCFYQQRLLLGGLKARPNTWMVSAVGDYYNLDERLDEANGAFVVTMDVPGGEAIERMVAGRNLMIFTSEAEYWLADRALSKTTPPNHVQASRHGTARGVPIVESEGAAIFVHETRGVVGEFRYTEVDGNFIATSISLIASHLFDGVSGLAMRRASRSQDGNTLAAVLEDGALRLGTLLREQEVTGFVRRTTDGKVIDAWCNGRNEMMLIVERPVAAGVSRRLERLVPDLLLDGALSPPLPTPSAVLTGLGGHEGREVWVIADEHVLGPFTVASGTVTLPFAVSTAVVGRWKPPRVTPLPPSRNVGANIVIKRPARIHSVVVNVENSTSLAVQPNDGMAKNIDLRRMGSEANMPELASGANGDTFVRGLTGYRDAPTVTITQVRPGRLRVRSITVENSLGQ